VLVRVRVRVRVRLRLRVRVRVRVWVIYIYTCIYIHVYTCIHIHVRKQVTSGWAAAEYLASMEPPCRKAFVIGSPALVSEMQARGITCVTEAGGDVSSEAGFAGLELDAGVEAVVSGWDAQFTWSKLAVASAYLQVNFLEKGVFAG
jgi:ribonucleotide monophosphatase NagD (HAD superfamily)